MQLTEVLQCDVPCDGSMVSRPAHVDDEGHVGELVLGAAGVGELLALGHRVHDLPLAVGLVRVHVDRARHVGQVHLGRVVRPRPEHHLACLRAKPGRNQAVRISISLAHSFWLSDENL